MTLRGMSTETEGQQMVSIVKRMRDLRDAMVSVWDESRKYRVSDEVHVVEVQILSRYKSYSFLFNSMLFYVILFNQKQH